ncbi:tetratricopeptide repeat protein, partial [Actinoplanes sp. NPDC051633]|uniref:tetratricopeptide repeat protein n=1 Tax=Actinoplanes sp. NPDC051633 TaxID=3155670 RepID=UPI003426B5A9
MTAAHLPGSASVGGGSLRPRMSSAADASAIAEQLRQATAAARSGRHHEARRELDALDRVIDRAEVPPDAQELLADLGQTAAFPPALRADALVLYARCREHNRDYRDALRAYRQAIELAPTPERVASQTGLSARVSGPAEAQQQLDKWLRRWPQDPRLLARSASLALDVGDISRAKAILKRAASREDPELLPVVARLNLMENDPQAALEPARATVPLHPSLGRALYAIALGRTGQLDEDPGVVDAVLADPPSDVWVLTHFAGLLVESGRLEEGQQVLDHLLTLDADNTEARRTRGLTAASLGDYETAWTDLALAAEGDDDPWLTAIRGDLARIRGDARTAVELLESLDPADEPPWAAAALGAALVALNEPDRATQAYERALAADGDSLDALCGLAQLLVERGADGRARAEELLRHAVALEPGAARPHALLGETMRRSGRHDEAVAAFDNALRIRPGWAYALAGKGQALVEFGDRKTAAEVLASAVHSEPTTPWVLARLVAVLESTNERGAEAVLRRIQHEVRAAGGDTSLLSIERARLAVRQGRPADADRLFRRARAAAPEDATLAAEHVEVLRKLGRMRDALASLSALPGTATADGDLFWVKIELLWGLDRLDDVRTMLEEMSAQGDPSALITGVMGELHRLDCDREGARRLLLNSIERDPDFAYSHASLGVLEADARRVDEARHHLREALRLMPDYAFAFENLVDLELSEGNEETVRGLLKSFAHSGAADTMAVAQSRAMYGLGDYSAALEIVQRALLETGDSADLLRSRGWTEIALGQQHRAAASFLAAAECPDPDLLDVVDGLLQVDHWPDALRLIVRARQEESPHAHLVLTLALLQAGRWADAAAQATAEPKRLRAEAYYFVVAARALRRSGQPQAALRHARQAVARSPRGWFEMTELAECQLANGYRAAAGRSYAGVLDMLQRR